MKVLIDTDVLSLFLRGNINIGFHIESYLHQHDTLHISIINHYEILSGLCFKDARKQLAVFNKLLSSITVLPLCSRAVNIASQQYAATRKRGTVLDDIDLLIASIALANDMSIATNNLKHFSKIPELSIVDWMAS